MQLQGHTVLVTGGATGIGFGIAELFTAAGSEVIISGRRQEALDQARKKLPNSDKTSQGSRQELDAIYQRMNG